MRPGAQPLQPRAPALQPPRPPCLATPPFSLQHLASPLARSPSGPTSPYRSPAPQTCRLPSSPFASACCEEKRPTPVTGPASQHEIQLFLPFASDCSCAHWTVGFSVKRGGHGDWILRSCLKAIGGERKEGVSLASGSLVSLKVGARGG